MGKRALSRVLLGLVVVGLAVLAAGCGGSSSNTVSPAAATTTTGAAGASSAFQACLKSHGVTLSFPGGGRPPGGQAGAPPTGTPPTSRPQGANGGPPAGFGQLTAKQRAAMTACQSKLPAGARNRGAGPNAGAANGGPANAAFKKYTACLKSHGVTFGTASASGTKFAKAAAACKSLLPTTGAATP